MLLESFCYMVPFHRDLRMCSLAKQTWVVDRYGCWFGWRLAMLHRPVQSRQNLMFSQMRNRFSDMIAMTQDAPKACLITVHTLHVQLLLFYGECVIMLCFIWEVRSGAIGAFWCLLMPFGLQEQKKLLEWISQVINERQESILEKDRECEILSYDSSLRMCCKSKPIEGQLGKAEDSSLNRQMWENWDALASIHERAEIMLGYLQVML